jgi:hypothetical protein
MAQLPQKFLLACNTSKAFFDIFDRWPFDLSDKDYAARDGFIYAGVGLRPDTLLRV